jgi:hypothetical protein
MSTVRRHPLIVFFMLAYAFSWWPWPLFALGLAPGYILGFGPFAAARGQALYPHAMYPVT